MENKFLRMAIAETTLSELMGERAKIDTDEVIAKFPNGITLTAFDIVELDGKTYPIFLFSEDESRFLNGGMILGKIVNRWLSEYGGDIEACSSDLGRCGGVKIRLERSRTKGGKNITEVKFC